jgi:hypothetical protein
MNMPKNFPKTVLNGLAFIVAFTLTAMLIIEVFVYPDLRDTKELQQQNALLFQQLEAKDSAIEALKGRVLELEKELEGCRK